MYVISYRGIAVNLQITLNIMICGRPICGGGGYHVKDMGYRGHNIRDKGYQKS